MALATGPLRAYRRPRLVRLDLWPEDLRHADR